MNEQYSSNSETLFLVTESILEVSKGEQIEPKIPPDKHAHHSLYCLTIALSEGSISNPTSSSMRLYSLIFCLLFASKAT